jgi:4-hydroxythreonine-4-phosphate dehydrogenase
MSDNRIRVGITCGDFNGIGYEVVIKTLSDARMSEMLTPVLYGSSKVLAYYKNRIEESKDFSFVVVSSAREARLRRINAVHCGDDNVKVEPGVSSAEAGATAVASLRAAVAELKAGLLVALVTAPINKENVQQAGLGHTGHTEFLAAEFGGEPLMLMCSEPLKVGLATVHVPISRISSLITKELITSRLRELRRTLVQDFAVVEPRIAVLSLNPHAGDSGLSGDEERQTIRPAVEQAIAGKAVVLGPFAADGFFASDSWRKYDAILAMYHDQGLIPFKSLAPEGVNFTAGLPVVRTSPDHGVAYDIAGQNIADPSSMRAAIYAAMDIFTARNNYREISKNPLRRFERERTGADLSVKDLIQEGEQ